MHTESSICCGSCGGGQMAPINTMRAALVTARARARASRIFRRRSSLNQTRCRCASALLRSITSMSGAGAAWRSRSARCRSWPAPRRRAKSLRQARQFVTSFLETSSHSTERRPVEHVRRCRQGRDNFCDVINGIYGFHIDGFLRERMNIPARLAVKAPAGLDATCRRIGPDHLRDSRAYAFREREA